MPPPWGADYQHDLLRTPAPREPLLNGTLTLREDWNEDFGANLKQTDADEKGPNSNRRVTFPGFLKFVKASVLEGRNGPHSIFSNRLGPEGGKKAASSLDPADRESESPMLAAETLPPKEPARACVPPKARRRRSIRSTDDAMHVCESP